MALPGTSAFFKAPTALEQLLEEINFQRTKEMRQLMKDDSGFVVLQGTSYWTDLFVRHFLFQTEHCIDCDDLLFFVRKKHIKSSSRFLPKFETEVDVFRKASRKLPIGDPDMDWEETVYLNLIIHQFDYTLTLAICTRTSPKELQVLKRHSQKVYASPSRRRMDTKAEAEEMTYPNICFMVDNFNEVFCDILVRDGEMVCVELVASDRDGAVQGVIFLGSIRYDALKRVYDARSSLSSKVAQRMTFGLFSNASSQRVEFVRMKGPQGKGHAEMAVTKPKGCGAETPTSEPGYCATDMWDSDWDSDPEDFFVYRHQRRLSDPSANINNFVRGGWKTKPADTAGAKSRSENEGLDSLANGLNEIEAGDIRDDREFCKNATSTICEPSISNRKIPSPEDTVPTSSIIASFFPLNKTRVTENDPDAVETLTNSKCSPSLADEPLPEPTTPVNDLTNRNDPKLNFLTGTGFNCTDKDTKTMDKDIKTIYDNTKTVNCSGKDVNDEDEDDDDFEDCVSSLSEATPVPKSNDSSPEDSPVHREIWEDATDVCVHSNTKNCEICALQKLALSNESNQCSNTHLDDMTYLKAQGVSLKKDHHEKVLPGGKIKTDVLQTRLEGNGTCLGEKGELKNFESTNNDGSKSKTRCKHNVEVSCILCGNRRPFFAKLREKHDAQVKLLEKENLSCRTNSRAKLFSRLGDASGHETESLTGSQIDPEPKPESPHHFVQKISQSRKTDSGMNSIAGVIPESELGPEPKSSHDLHRMLLQRGKTDPGINLEADFKPELDPEPNSPRRLNPSLSRRRKTDSGINPELVAEVIPESELHSEPNSLRRLNPMLSRRRKTDSGINRELVAEVVPVSELRPEPNSPRRLNPVLSRRRKTDSGINPKLVAEVIPESELDPEPKSPHHLNPTLSRRRKTESSCQREMVPPHREMPDGTSIYYWCDVTDKPPDLAEHELDDGAYNPLWTMRGFTQTFHFWKENKRAQSVPLNAFLTYITLPWWSIAKDILDHREKPTLTF